MLAFNIGGFRRLKCFKVPVTDTFERNVLCGKREYSFCIFGRKTAFRWRNFLHRKKKPAKMIDPWVLRVRLLCAIRIFGTKLQVRDCWKSDRQHIYVTRCKEKVLNSHIFVINVLSLNEKRLAKSAWHVCPQNF